MNHGEKGRKTRIQSSNWSEADMIDLGEMEQKKEGEKKKKSQGLRIRHGVSMDQEKDEGDIPRLLVVGSLCVRVMQHKVMIFYLF